MKQFFLFGLFFPAMIFATKTTFISDNDFENIWLWQLSNTTITEEQGITLSQDTTLNYKTSRLLWTAKKINDNIYLGTADSATIIKLSPDFKETIVYTNKDKSLVTAIVQDNNGILASTSPDSELIHIDTNNKMVTNISLSNNYIWDIVPNPKKGFEILTGLPAEVYHYEDNKLSESIPLSNEEHILKGLYVNGNLWILGENALYKKQNNKFIAIASIPGTATSFIYTNNTFYIIASVTPKNSNNTKQDAVNSILFGISDTGIVEKLYSLQGFYFTSIGIHNQSIIIGGDQFGLYVFYDLVTKKSSYASLGSGKILEILSDHDQLKLLTSDTSAIWTINNKLATEGSFVSEIYDTENISSWGNFSAKISTPPNTSIQFFIQSGVVEEPDYWADWIPIKIGQKIPVANGQYIRYKAILKSNGKKSPFVYDITFPYTQINLAPIFNVIDITQEEQNLKISWKVNDPNEDQLEYNIYLSDDGMPKIKLTDIPITNTNFTLQNYLYPSGDKRISIIASDRPSNSDQTALYTEYNSIPINFDSDNPMISDYTVTKNNKNAIINFTINDQTSIIQEVVFFINGQQKTYILPKDGIFDSKREEFSISIPLTHALFLQVQASDAAHNMSSKGITILPENK